MKVSVILPVYNGQAFLRQALESALRQTYRNVEIIAIDDGSTDASLEILKENTHEDVDLWVRVHDEAPFSFIPEPLVQYRRDHRHHKQKKRSSDVESENYFHLYQTLKARFHTDPSKKEAMDRILFMVLANKGKKLAHEGRFTEARSQFR
jgi:cellulose synthase/poly-beta-1,6-N-acetylglucosamine synthase-like glycosyltransferase